MEKKLFFKFSDGGDVSNIVMELSGCLAWMEADELLKKDEDELSEIEYTLKPILLTEKEYRKLPEAEI